MIDVLGRLVVPSGVILLLTITSLILFILHFRRFAILTAVSGLVVYTVFGSGLVAHALLGPLERWHPPVTDASSLGDVDLIVVLTGHASRLETVSPPNWVNDSSAYRMIEAMWLKAQNTDSRILISGSLVSAMTLRDVFLSLGLDEGEVLVDADAHDTAQSAANLKRHLKNDETCVLVTSAGHMPRAFMSFIHEGLNCLPVPTEFYTPFELSTFTYLPTPRKLSLSDHAIHEYLGIAWYRMRGKL